MANNDTLKGVGVTGTVTVTANKEVLDAVANIEWTNEDKAAIRAIQRALSTSRKPVTTDDVVKDIKKALATKAKTTFYTPFETEFKNAERVASRMQRPIETTLTEYMHKHVPASAWEHMAYLGCKLDVAPPVTGKDVPVTDPAAVATLAAMDALPPTAPKAK